VENTFVHDLPDLAACLAELPLLHEQMLKRWLPHQSRYRVAGKTIKLKFNNFVSTTAEQFTDNADASLYPQLMAQAWARHQRPVRLLGVGVKLVPRDAHARDQLSLELDMENPT
jgi:DNA polymerase-4